MGGYAWVTLATNDSYSLGALVLAHSLKQAGTQQQLAVLVTPGVTSSMRGKLRQVFNVVQEVNILDSKDEANLRLLKRPELGITFTKLHCWRLTQFDKCVFLDADTLVLENCDELFEREELSAAPDVGWPDCFNSGVFVYRPSNETYEKLVQFALEKGSFDGGDQGLLNLYFSDWAHKDISKHLPFIYNMCSTACYSYLPAFKQFGTNAKIIHFIGATKPWLQYFDTETKKVHPSGEAHHLQDVLQRWWNIFCSLIHPNLTTDMSGLAGAFAQLTLGTPRTLEQAALDDHLRRQGWEVGNIDYLGRDSFDNIWSKICETLAAAPEPPAPKTKAPSPPAESEVKVPEESAPEAISKKKLSQSVQETQPEVQSELVKEEPAVPEKVESQGAELEPSSEPALAPTPETPAKAEETLSKPEIALEQTKPDAAPMEAPEPKPAPLPLPESPKPIPESPRDTPVPLPESPKPISESPRDASVPLPESPKPNPKSHRDAPIPLPESPKSLADTALTSAPILLPESPKPLKVALESPKFIPGTVPESSKPAPEAVPESSKVVPEAAFESPEPAPETATESLTTVSGAVPEISKPTPEAVPKSQKPVAEIGSETSKPVELAPESPKLVPEKTRESPRSAPETFPESPKPTTVVPESPKPVPEVAPEISKPAPEVVTENSKVQSPKPTAAPESLKPRAAPESPKTTAAPKSAKPAAAPESPKPATESVLDSKKAVKTEKKIKPAAEEAVKAPENPKLEPAPQTCPVAPKSGAEKKTSSKKLKEAAQPPKAEVTEATPPSTPVSPQPKQTKQALVVETSTPDTPPPTSSEASGATPTPPPRKGSGAPKKTVTKSKK